MRGNFVIKRMTGPRLEMVVDTVFPQNTSAYAFLVTRIEARGGAVVFKEDDAENPGCMDIMADFGGALEQYAIETA